MENKSVNFGYLNEYPILEKLKVHDYMRGCNAISGLDISDYYDTEFIPPLIELRLPRIKDLVLPRGLKTFLFRRLSFGNNRIIEKLAYAHLLVGSFAKQINENLVRDGLVFCNFDHLENEDIEDLTDLVNYFNQVLEFRGYNSRVINGELLIINVEENMEDQDINDIVNTHHKSLITIKIVNTIKHKEEDLYRASSELLLLLPRYNEIMNKWKLCKERLECVNLLSFKETFELNYDILYVFAFFNSSRYEEDTWEYYANFSPEAMMHLVRSIDVDAKQQVNLLINDLADCEFLLEEYDAYRLNVGKSVLLESIEGIESIIDSYFTPELKPFKCKVITEEDLTYLSYHLVKTHATLRPPIELQKDTVVVLENQSEEEVELEEIDEVEIKPVKKNLFKKYLPFITIILILVAVITSIM